MSNADAKELLKEVGQTAYLTKYKLQEVEVSILTSIGKKIEYGYVVSQKQIEFCHGLISKMKKRAKYAKPKNTHNKRETNDNSPVVKDKRGVLQADMQKIADGVED